MVALPDSARTLLEGKTYAHVITRNRDGSPQVAMVWAHVDGDEVLFSTPEGRLKLTNLRRDPRIIASIQDPEEPQQYLIVHGTATLTTDGADDLIDLLARKMMGLENYPWRQPGEQRVTVRIAVDRIGGAGPWVARP